MVSSWRLLFGATAIRVAALYLLIPSWQRVDILRSIPQDKIFLILGGVALLAWFAATPVSSTSQKKRKSEKSAPARSHGRWIYGIIALLAYTQFSRFFSSPVLPHPLRHTFTHPVIPLLIHSSIESKTGLIVVGEALPDDESNNPLHSVRYLRAAHSILGGVWMGSKIHTIDGQAPITDIYGTKLGDSIYGVFVLQEAARMVVVPQGRQFNNALIIGLGTGISATAFQRHGLSVTIVEIDASVFEAAIRFFGLSPPAPGHVFIEDAQDWVARKSLDVEAGIDETLYDIIVHDCFSGGGVPEQLYTQEFWQNLKRLLHADGVLVVNFVGRVVSEASGLVFRTLEASIGPCRAFHDVMDDFPPEKHATEFVNMVFFCSIGPRAVEFRNSQQADYLGSPLRRHILSSLQQREIDAQIIRNASNGVITSVANPLGKIQADQGHYHWKLMRKVLKDIFWEIY